MSAKKAFIHASFNESLQEYNPGLNHKAVYFQFPLLSMHDKLVHGVFTRHGGFSEPPYDTLNTGYDVGDRPENVRANLEVIKEAVGAEHLRFMDQVHDQNIIVLRQDNSLDLRISSHGDAIITDQPRLAIMVKQADCQGIILFDPVKAVVSIVHCGWRGNAINILGSVVRRMRSDFGCRERDLIAAIGPSLGPCCGEFITHKEIFPLEFREFMVREDYFDLWQIGRRQLLQAGLKKESIEVVGICTRCRTDLFYSYRAEGITGRFATVVMLK